MSPGRFAAGAEYGPVCGASAVILGAPWGPGIRFFFAFSID